MEGGVELPCGCSLEGGQPLKICGAGKALQSCPGSGEREKF